jgi:uncharacterized membrane protein
MDLLKIGLSVSALLCALVAGLVLAFAIVVMPGIRNLNDHDYLQAFKVMDRVIQNNHPVFILVWLGSAVALIVTAVLGWWKLDGFDRWILVAGAALYVFGVQTPTVTINVPLNNELQSRDLDAESETGLFDLRARFETRWTKWNSIRTIVAIVTTALLIVLLLRL